MKSLDSCRHQLSVHGLAVDLTCDVPLLNLPIRHLLEEFAVADWPAGFQPVCGSVKPYEEAVVMRRVSQTATLIPTNTGALELYEDRERFWMIDDRWGLSEINLLKGQWNSWILPEPSVDAVRIAEQAIQWPLAQLLRARGLTMLPAAAVVRGDFAMLMIAPFGVEPELSALIRAGFKIIGQQWTALREEDGRIAMLHLPGLVERIAPPRLRATSAGGLDNAYSWVDVIAEHCGSNQHHAFADVVLIINRARRPLPSLRRLPKPSSLATLRGAWPIVELHPHRRHGQMPAKLAQQCAVFECQLSRSTDDLLGMVEQMQHRDRAIEFTASNHFTSKMPVSSRVA